MSWQKEHEEDSRTMADVVLNSPLIKSFLAGSLSGTCSTLLFQPLDLLKTRLQRPELHGHAKPAGMMTHFVQVVKNERLLGLWRGTVPSITRCVPGVGMYFCSLHFLKTNLSLDDPSPLEAMALGVGARSLVGVALLPVTVIKTRFESGVYNYRNMREALKLIYQTEGAKGLYSGLMATVVRDAPFSGIYLMFYTSTKRLLPPRVKEGSHVAFANFTCGLVAGLLASSITQPADVIKTKMQLYPNKFARLSVVVLYIYEQNGAAGFFRGLVPRVLRRTLMTAMAWSFYEQLSRGFHLK